MNILLICMIPVCIIATGFLVLKSVQLGLKWQIQTAEKKEPEIKDPFTQVINGHSNAVQQKKIDEANKQREEMLKELNPFIEG